MAARHTSCVFLRVPEFGVSRRRGKGPFYLLAFFPFPFLWKTKTGET